MVNDIRPGSRSSNPGDLTDVDGTLHFTANNGAGYGDEDIHGEELWKSDGTEAGTIMVKNIQPD